MVGRHIPEYFRLRPRSSAEIGRQVDDEIDLHLELRVQELVEQGASPEAARAEAERLFGEVAGARARLRNIAEERELRMSASEWLLGLRQDIRYAARALSGEPLLALVVVVTMALGIGANVVMFGIVDELVLRGPAHVTAPEQVRRVYLTERDGAGNETTRSRTAYILYSHLRARRDAFAQVAAYTTGTERMGRGEHAREVPVAYSTHDLFALLGVKPLLGRFYAAEEAQPKQPRFVAVIDYGFWQTEFGGSGDVLGRTLELADTAYTIIGVTPKGFTGPERTSISVWVPLPTTDAPVEEWPTSWNASWLHLIARVRPDVGTDRATDAATAAYSTAQTESPPPEWRRGETRISLRPIAYTAAGSEPAEFAVSRWLGGVSLIVLLVACANVINLLLARGVRRRRELAVRLALGITRGRMVRLLLSETLLLTLAGGLLAALLAHWGGQFIRATLLPEVQWAAPLTVRVLFFTALSIVLTTLVVGLAPALQAHRHDVTSALKSSALRGGVQRSRVRSALTVLQAALSLVLLIGAGLFVRSLWNVRQLDLGIDADQVLAVWTTFSSTAHLPPEQRAAERARRTSFYEQAAQRLRTHPQVAGAAIAIGTPMQGGMGVVLRVPGRDSIPELPGGGPFIVAASSGYFETVGTQIVRGRGVQPADGRNTEAVAIVNETMARTLWPNEDPFTKCIYIGSSFDGSEIPCSRVVGIAEDAKQFGLRDEPAMQYYVPFGQARNIGGTQIVLRVRGDPADFVPELRRLLHQIEPAAIYFTINPLQEVLDPQMRPWRLGATMFLVFGGLALLIAGIGLYSVVAYGVAQRRTEIGVRLALGARAATIIGLVARDGLRLVLLGILLGLPLALLGGRMVETLLFDTSVRDAATFTVVATALIVVALAASVVPALRAARTSPVNALRAE